MASTPVRVTDDLLDRLDARADGRARAEMVQVAIEGYLNPEPQTDFKPQADLPVLMFSPSQKQCLGQLAERAGVEPVELMKRWVSERLRREFVDDRNRLLQDLKR